MILANCWRSAGVLGLLLIACDAAEDASGAHDTGSSGTQTDGGSDEIGTTGSASDDDETDDTTQDGDAGSSSGAAEPITCDVPLIACDASCVDVDRDPDNCGVCGVSCEIPNAVAACSAGSCDLGQCNLGWADCDGTITNGCETTDTCEVGGACASACGTTGSLACDDPCAPICTPPTEACNVADDDCDGACDEGELPGCRVGVHVADDPILGQVLMVDPAEAKTLGVTIQQMNAFFLYTQPGPGTQPLHRCAGAGAFGYSPDNNCEQLGGIDITLGFFSPEQQCAAIPLSRLTLDPDGLMLSADPVEIDQLVGDGWTIDAGFSGFAWPSG